MRILESLKIPYTHHTYECEEFVVKDINAITGYIRGGCTAIGMKKQYVTRIDESAKTQEQIYVSGGRIGSQIQLKPDDLAKAAKAEFADIIRHEN